MITDGLAGRSSIDGLTRDGSFAAQSKILTDAAPPMGNTGVEMTGVGLGWLQGTVKKVDPQRIVALLASALGSESEARAGGTRCTRSP